MTEIETRAALIREHDFFSSLSEPQILELAQLAADKKCSPEDLITLEGDLVDAVYLVVSGEIEINVGHVPKGVLRKGDAIGLTETGFYSQTGLRTATLKAISTVTLLGWELDTFHAFLERHPSFRAAMKESADKMLRAYFIKQAVPFADLPGATITQVAQTMDRITVPAGTYLFHQGEFADHCYLICAGEVEIIIEDEEGNTKSVDKLPPLRLFGESALLVRRERTASARVSETAQLLVLEASQLHRLMRHRSTYDEIMALVSKHILPKRAANIEYFQSVNAEGELIHILKDKRHGGYYRLSEEGWLIWQQLDGRKTLRGLVTEIQRPGNFVGIKAVADTILDLANAGFVSLPELNPAVKTQFDNWRSMKLKLAGIDSQLNRVYRGFVHLFFAKPGRILMAGTALLGAILFSLFLLDLAQKILWVSNFIFILVAVLVVYQATGLLHELAHGFATKYFQREVHRGEIALTWLGLKTFVDTSEMWTTPAHQRIFVSLAGAYFDLFLAGIAAIIAFFILQPDTSVLLWLCALTLYYRAFQYLNPMNGKDGYLALKDALDDSILRFNAFNWLRNKLPFVKPGIAQLKSSRSEIIYWLTCSSFLILGVVFAFVVQHYMRLLLPPMVLGVPTDHLIWILPLIVVANFIVTVFINVRKL